MIHPPQDTIAAALIDSPAGLAAWIVDKFRDWAERACTDIRRWHVPDRGGHFMPLEQPDLLADELRAFFGRFARFARLEAGQ